MTPYEELVKQFDAAKRASSFHDNAELQTLLDEIKGSIEVERVPKAILDFFVEIGVDPQKINRATQIVVDVIATKELGETDLPGPIDAYVAPYVREFLVNLVAKKFNAFISGGSTA